MYDDYGRALSLLALFDVHSQEQPLLRDGLYGLLLGVKQVWDSRTLNALPNTLVDVEKALQANDIAAVHQPLAKRSIQWLHENGKCIDHIVPGRSTIPGAGHGAFAKRDLPNGTTITGSPLHHVPSRRFFEMYAFDEDNHMRRTNRIIGLQLLVNYCFSHPLTTLHLCPYGAGVNYINHNKTMANVKVQWAEDGKTSHNATWLEMDPQSMNDNYKPSLALDYVATKDIKEGEELFLDYGDVWETAWRAHLEQWEQSGVGRVWESYKSAFEYNREHGNDPLRTEEEQQVEPYPDNLQIRCHADLLYESESASDYEEMIWEGEDWGYSCHVLEWDDTSDTYTVAIAFEDNNYSLRRSGVPRVAIAFADTSYSTDMHLPGAFRHPLVLPDELLPRAWMNLPNA